MNVKRAACLALASLLLLAAAPVFATPTDFDYSYAAAFPPGHYGGVYLDKDGTLITVIVEKYKHLYDQYPPEVKIRFGKYSLQELNALMNQLIAFSEENSDLRLFTDAYLDVSENCVYVGMLDPSDKNIAEFIRLVSDSPAIRFYQGEYDVIEPLPLAPEEGKDVGESTPNFTLP